MGNSIKYVVSRAVSGALLAALKLERLKYDIKREAENISIVIEYLRGEEILPFNQSQIIERTKSAYSLLGKTFKKQTKIIEDPGEKYKGLGVFKFF